MGRMMMVMVAMYEIDLMRTGGIGASVLSDHAPAHPVELIQQQVC
jgi:hypothetical protein